MLKFRKQIQSYILNKNNSVFTLTIMTTYEVQKYAKVMKSEFQQTYITNTLSYKYL